MATDFKLLFYIKKTEAKADGTCPIMGRISIVKTMAQFSTKQTTAVSLWFKGMKSGLRSQDARRLKTL